MRTAAFFGVPRIVLSDHSGQAGPSDASYRVAEGGLEHVELYRAPRFAQCCSACADTIASSPPLPRTDSRSPRRARERPFALVLGNEERGLPRATLEACDEVVTIPGSGFVQSLNVAASAAILLHALIRQSATNANPDRGARTR